jgi:hypothetical protein
MRHRSILRDEVAARLKELGNVSLFFLHNIVSFLREVHGRRGPFQPLPCFVSSAPLELTGPCVFAGI